MFTDSVTIFLKLFKIAKFLMGLEVIRDWNLGGNQNKWNWNLGGNQKSEISKGTKKVNLGGNQRWRLEK